MVADIRLARESDLPELVAIYNHEVLHSTATFDTQTVTVDEWRHWLRAHEPTRHPILVAQEGARALGFASLSEWSKRCAYARAAEVSIYIHRDARGRGLGRALLGALIQRARAIGLGVLLARIVGTGGASNRLHESLGFTHIGSMRRVGQKFGKILDVELYDLQLDEDRSSDGQ